MSRSRPERSEAQGERGLRPKYRRAFGCVTWLYMGILAFLGAATLLAWPLRYIGDGTAFGQILSRLAFFGLALLLPAMLLAAILGARTYRVETRLGRRAGTLVGAVVGWTSFFALSWLAVALSLEGRDELFRPVLFAGLGGSVSFYLFVPLALLAAGLVTYALYSRRTGFNLRRRLIFAGAGLAVFAGLLVLLTGFDLLGIVGVLISTLSGAAGGWVSGIGYARAGGDAMIPPGSTIRPIQPRRKPR